MSPTQLPERPVASKEHSRLEMFFSRLAAVSQKYSVQNSRLTQLLEKLDGGIPSKEQPLKGSEIIKDAPLLRVIEAAVQTLEDEEERYSILIDALQMLV